MASEGVAGFTPGSGVQPQCIVELSLACRYADNIGLLRQVIFVIHVLHVTVYMILL